MAAAKRGQKRKNTVQSATANKKKLKAASEKEPNNNLVPEIPQPVKKSIKTKENVKPKKEIITPQKVSHRSHSSAGGTVLTLGEGDVGQLGLGPDVMERVKPASIDLDEEVMQVAAGGMHTCVLSTTGKVYTWGCNDEGALGRPTTEEGSESEPGVVTFDGTFVAVSAGDSHTAALTHDGKVFAWGTFRDANGTIGLKPDTRVSQTPTQISIKQNIVKISSGTDHLVCLTSEGEIITFGNSEQGQLGRVAECFSNRGGRKGLAHILNPSLVRFTKRKARFSDVWTGQYGTFAQSTAGEIFAWGLNNYYQLGSSSMVNPFIPTLMPSFSKSLGWLQISGGQHHTLALDKTGKVYSLGRKEYGRLGIGEKDLEEKSTPTLVTQLKNTRCKSVASGTAVSFAVAETGELYGWGMGTSKQLAQREEDDLYTPTLMEGKQLQSKNVLAVSAGGQHTVILAKEK